MGYVGALVSERDLGVVETNPHRETFNYEQNSTGHDSNNGGSLLAAPAIHGRGVHPALVLKQQSNTARRRASTGTIAMAQAPLSSQSFLLRGGRNAGPRQPPEGGQGERGTPGVGLEAAEGLWMHLTGATEGGIPLPGASVPFQGEARDGAEDDGGGDIVGGREAVDGAVEDLTINGEDVGGGVAVAGGEMEDVVKRTSPFAALRGADDSMVTVSKEWLEE
jgi:hypothetical protein